jgi:hypothetical protein
MSREKEAGMRRKLLKAAGPLLVAALIGALFPGTGAVAAGGRRTFRLELSGANEVSPSNPHGAGDHVSGVITMNLGQRTVCWRFGELTLVEADDLPEVGHIHPGAAGSANAPILTLFGAPANPSPTTTPPAPTSYPTGTVCVENVNRALIVQFFQNPEGFYVNLHNETHPTGAVRDQLR